MRVQFSAAFFTELTTRPGCTAQRVAALTAMQARGFEVQGSPRPGRVNVRIPHADGPGFSYRTYAERDLAAVAA